MKDLYHFHLTIADCTAEELKNIAKYFECKPTTIDLYNDKYSQKDRMLTKYYLNLNLCKIEAVGISKLIKKVFNKSCVRVKIEAILPDLPDNVNHKYIELHLKVPADSKEYPMFQLSRNPSEGDTKFLNCRIYNSEDIPKVMEVISKIPGVIKYQYEEVIIDSKPLLDKWWAEEA